MNRDKQIEEMVKVLKGMDRFDEAKFGFYESYARAKRGELQKMRKQA